MSRIIQQEKTALKVVETLQAEGAGVLQTHGDLARDAGFRAPAREILSVQGQ